MGRSGRSDLINQKRYGASEGSSKCSVNRILIKTFHLENFDPDDSSEGSF